MEKIMWFVILGCLLLSPVTAQADSQQCALDFDGVCNLSNITGANIATEGLFAGSNYTAQSYKTGTHGQPKDTENRSDLSQPEKDSVIYIIHDAQNSFPMFSNAEFVNFTIVGDTITLTLDNNAIYDGVCNLSDIMGSNISAAGTSVELNYFPITYRNLSYDNKWASAPYFNDTENRLYLLSGSGMVTKFKFCMEENSTSVNKTIPKVVGVGDLVGQFQIETTAEGITSNYNRLGSNIKGVGYMDSYVQYAPDTSYENTTFITTFLDCERLQLQTGALIEPGIRSIIQTAADVLGIASGAEPVPEVSHELSLGLQLDVEYFPVTYRNYSYDQTWNVTPYFNSTTNRLHLLSGTGIVTKFKFTTEESSTSVNKTIPKVVGVGDLVGQFQMETMAEGINSTYNWLEANIKGVGYMDAYVQYAPDTSYENTTFMPTFLDCEKLQLKATAVYGTVVYDIEQEEGLVLTTTADVLGIASGAVPVPEISHDWISELELDVEYFPTTYRNYSYDQTWNVTPYFNSTTNRLYLSSGSGIVTKLKFTMEENSTSVNKTIPKVVGVGDLVGQFQLETTAKGLNSTYNWLESNIKGVGYMDSYVQYAPDTSYENTTFIPTFLECERLLLQTGALIEPGIGSGIETTAEVLGIASGAEYLNFSTMPLDHVAIEAYFDLEYHPVNISGDILDECWSVKPVPYDDILAVLRGTGTATTLNFSFNDSTAALPEIFSYGYLSGDYNITTNIFPHSMNASATGTNVSAMDGSGQGGFGIQFSDGPRYCTCGDICVDTTGWWRNGEFAKASDTPIQHAVDNATVGETVCVKDGTYHESINVNESLTIRSENGSAATIVQAASLSDHVFNVTANYVNISGFTARNAISGIYLYNVRHCNISDNNVTNNSGGGIYMNNSSNNSLTDNHASANEHGIKLAYSSNNNSLSYNTAFNNTEDGIYVDDSSNNTLSSNTVNSNNGSGIYLEDSSNNTFSGNTISNNKEYGIYLYSSNNNTIYNNCFSNTNNAWDNANNIWNITKQAGTNIVGGPNLGGNYWSDYAGVDNDGDGLGDTLLPYNSSGNITNGGDWHPLIPLYVHLSVRGTDNGVWYTNRDSNGSWDSWQLVQNGYTTDSPALTSTADGAVHVAVRGTDDGVWYINRDACGSWSGWALVKKGYTTDSPTLTSTADGAVHVAVRGTDDGVWYINRDACGSWSGWELVQSGYTINSPALTSTADGAVHVAVRGTDDGVWYNNRTTSGSWSGWALVQSGYTTDSPALASTADGTVHVAVRGLDEGVWYNNRNATSGNWSGWELVQSGYTINSPALTTTTDGAVHVAVQGLDGGVWYNNRTTSGNWGSWELVQSGYTTDAPALTSTTDSAVHAAVRGVDGGVWYNRRSSGNWDGWQHVQSGYTYNSPAVTS